MLKRRERIVFPTSRERHEESEREAAFVPTRVLPHNLASGPPGINVTVLVMYVNDRGCDT